MSFLSSIGNFFGKLFGGDDDERKKKPTNNFQAPQKAPVSFGPANQNQNRQSILPNPGNLPPANGLNLVLPGMTPAGRTGLPLLQKATPKAATPSPEDAKRAELDRLTEENYQAAKKQREQGESWFGRNLLNKGHIDQDARVLARSRATKQYQEKHGWVRDPVVLDYGQGTRKLGEEHSAQLQKEGDRLNKIQKTMTKAAQIAQYVPVTGSVLNLGLAGAEQSDLFGLKKDIRNQRNLNEFDMTSEQLDALPEDTRKKLQLIRNISYGLAPLDFTGLGGLAKSEGVNVAKRGALQLLKKGTVDAATKQGIKTIGVDTAKNLAKATAVGTGVSLAGQQYLAGEVDPLAALKTGALMGGTNELFNPTQLRKAPVPEVAPGIKSANPRQVEDAADAAAQAEREAAAALPPPEDLDTPAYQRAPAKKAAAAAETAAQAAEAEKLAPTTALDTKPAFQHKQDIQDVIRQGDDELNEYISANPGLPQPQVEAVRASIQAQVVQRITDLQAGRTGATGDVPAIQPAAASAPVPQTPAAVTSAAPAVEQVPTPAQVEGDIETSAVATPATAAEAAPLPELPQGAPDQLPAAPLTYDAVVKQIGGGRELKGNYAMRDKLDLDAMKQEAAGVVANMDDAQLVQSVSSTSRELLAHDPQSFSLARATLDRLYAMKDNPVAQQQVSDVLEAMSKFASKNAQGLRIVQEEFDNMPLPMKVKYLANKIDAANADTKGYEPLGRDPARAAEVEAALTARLEASQGVAERVAALEDQINRAADAAREGQKVDIKGIKKVLAVERENLQKANGELVKYFQNLVPGRTKGQKALSDFPRMMMLSSFTGRLNDVLTTAANVVEQSGTNITQGILSKAYNLVKGPGAVSDTTKGAGALVKGVFSGSRKTVGEIKGNQYVDDIQKSLKGTEELRSGLRKAKGPVSRTIQSATEFATRASEGVRDQRLYQLADQEATQLGLKGGMRKQYANARAAVPTRQMLDAANELHMAVNNLNDNPISRTLAAVAKGMEGENRFGKTGVGGLIKNQVIPFTSWLGGNVWNSLTDRNVIANGYKFIRDAAKGNPEGAIRNLSKTINGAAQGYVLGYQLAKAGVLTDKDAEGYNDGGMYIHVGDRYIPVGFFGALAPNIVLGKAVHDGMNAEGESAAKATADAIGNFAWHGLALGNVIGVENNLNRAYQAGTRPGGNAADAAAVAAGGAAGQYIPAAGGDVNAVLNNGLELGGQTIIPDSLNPTHEAADTRVESNKILKSGEKSTAKDYPKSAVNTLINRIPFASQSLPRKAGVAADDLVDRTTRGSRETGAQKDAKVQAKTEADRAADFKARDIPNYKDKGFEDAVEARVQRGEYDKGIEALQAKLEAQKADKNIPDSKNKDMQDEIKQLQILKAGKFKPEIRDMYKSTSVTEWRNMGDPEHEDYDPERYQLLYDYDSALAKESISGSTLAHDKNKFTAKKAGSGSGGRGSAANRELARIRSNKIGSTPNLMKFDFDLRPEKAGSYKMPQLQQLRSSDLIKKRKITVGKA